MATIILACFLVVLTLAIAPWIGYENQRKLAHPIDKMAGDEGED